MQKLKRVCRTTRSNILAAILVPAAIAAGQSSSRNPRPNVLVEVSATHTSPEAERTYLYVRVLSNGMVEWQSSNPAADKKEPTINSKSLTNERFLQIKSVLDDPRLQKLSPKYETRFAIVDSWTMWRV